MPFLELALAMLARKVPKEMGEHFAPPKRDALRQQLFHPAECGKTCPKNCNGIRYLRSEINHHKRALVSPES